MTEKMTEMTEKIPENISELSLINMSSNNYTPWTKTLKLRNTQKISLERGLINEDVFVCYLDNLKDMYLTEIGKWVVCGLRISNKQHINTFPRKTYSVFLERDNTSFIGFPGDFSIAIENEWQHFQFPLPVVCLLNEMPNILIKTYVDRNMENSLYVNNIPEVELFLCKVQSLKENNYAFIITSKHPMQPFEQEDVEDDDVEDVIKLEIHAIYNIHKGFINERGIDNTYLHLKSYNLIYSWHIIHNNLTNNKYTLHTF